MTFGSLMFGILSPNWHTCAAWDTVVVWSVDCSCVILLVCLDVQSLFVQCLTLYIHDKPS